MMKSIMLIPLAILALLIFACGSEGQTITNDKYTQQQVASILAQIEGIDEALDKNLEQQACQNKIISAIADPRSRTYNSEYFPIESTQFMSEEELLRRLKGFITPEPYLVKQQLALSGQECWEGEYWISMNYYDRQETLNQVNNNLFELQSEYQNLLQQKMNLILELQNIE